MRRSVRMVLIAGAAALLVAAVIALVAVNLGNPGSSSPEASIEPRETSSPAAMPSDSPTPSPTQDPTGDPTQDPTGGPSPSPATTDEVQPEPTPVGSGTVTVVNWGADGEFVYASGIVTGDVGDAGTCTLTATSSSGQILTGQRDAQSTPAAVNCGVIQIQAPPGPWTLVLSYQSQIGSAASEPMVVTQP